ncbi:MAG: ankyrin repeat domain-containing protein [Alphaproteobacteria bacterium]|nr:MAG: ankyrin repeat domain-containing protein [Alphaproteobacteria bacterium]
MTLNSQQREVMNSLLLEAVGNQDLARMKTYVSKGANIQMTADVTETTRVNGSTYTSRGVAPLYHYMLESYFTTQISDLFLEQGVSADVKNFNGNTPLMLAVKNGDLGRVQYFLSKGADPTATNNRGDMVLDQARKTQAYYCGDRQAIIDALVQAIESPAGAQQAVAPEKAPEAAETTRDIQILKPLELSPRKKSGGFNL